MNVAHRIWILLLNDWIPVARRGPRLQTISKIMFDCCNLDFKCNATKILSEHAIDFYVA